MSKTVTGGQRQNTASTDVSIAVDHYPTPVSLYTADGDRKYVSVAERAALLSQLAGMPWDRRLFILTLMWTGARVSEVLALTPASFDVQAAVVAVDTLKRRVHHVREIPIPDALARELDVFYSLRRRQLSVDTRRSALWTYHRVTAWRFIQDAMHRAGINGVRATPRGLRHAFGVGTLAAGVPLNIVQRLLGHASIETTTIYTAASGPEERAIVQRYWRHQADC